MNTVSSFQPLLDVIYKLQVFLSRPPVQLQVIAILAVLICAGALSLFTWRQFGAVLKQWVERCS